MRTCRRSRRPRGSGSPRWRPPGRSRPGRAADLLGDAEWFTDPAALAESASVDLVVIAVRVPRHRELITAALPAGKPILSERPLGASTAEAEEITEAARSAGVRGFVVLQGRCDPVISEARNLVASGALGELQALSVRSSRTPGTVFPAPPGRGRGDRAGRAGGRGEDIRRVRWRPPAPCASDARAPAASPDRRDGLVGPHRLPGRRKRRHGTVIRRDRR
ncbi:Gfo/Idh/MocA family oxidoreductase [Actinomadura sp. LCR2-06]|uniref:Gfo/Idh/MocA family oxidoreductase n=1 Tax=Actinomadura violacea TaxID=2819934 RepID=A0ABS3S613_9ACTN|nr:Gfo/Idh/MocA family oxidoreductase [Actinomadura violacea]